MKQKRLFIVSNRLPVNITSEGGEDRVNLSSGGLVSAVSSYLTSGNAEKHNISEKLWVGVPGCSNGTWTRVARHIPESDFNYLPVFLNKKTYEAYYNGLSNSTIWPMFHYFPSYAEFNANAYEAYMQANREFADVLVKYLHPNDVVWIHDYHLLPLANMLRKQLPGLTIGFFLHIPFPSYEIFRIMPKKWQREMTEGMLGADLVGFHTIDYASHFLKSVQMVLGLDDEMHVVRFGNRLVKIDIFPVSIDFEKFNNAYSDSDVSARREVLKGQFKDRKVIFSVDRLDYTKGVHNRLKAYEYFLTEYPEYLEKVVFVLVVVPSRDSISKYAERKKMIDEYIGSLNSRIGNINWQPVIYQYNTLEFSELAALYTCCDLALITPLRDGMNLVAKEFVASRKDKDGVLVLSEMAGAVRELTDALAINPNDTEEMAAKIKAGLEMSQPEKSRRLTAMQDRIRQYDVTAWATDFFEQLNGIKAMQNEYEIKFLDNKAKGQLVESFQRAKKRLLLLDYDGTLTQLTSHPSFATPNEDMLDVLSGLSANPQNDVFIISGRDAATLDSWLGHLPINIIAEHGANFRYKDSDWQPEESLSGDWIEPMSTIMNNYVRRCANSFVETKQYSVAWHYRNAEEEQGALRAAELYNELLEYTNSMDIHVLRGNKVVEVRNKGVHKGAATKRILQHASYDFILACGDDVTDEDMFHHLASVNNAFTIKVGATASYARYNLHTPQMVLSMLGTLHNMAAPGYSETVR